MSSLENPGFVNFIVESPGKTTLLLVGTLVALWPLNVLWTWLEMRSHFKRLNIKAPAPWPLVGNLPGLIQRGIFKNDEHLIKEHGKITGYFEGTAPVILTTDANLIKTVTVKEFNSFANRRTFSEYTGEPFSNFLLSMVDEEWKNVRSLLTPTFTSGKLKLMSKTVCKCANNFMDHIKEVEQKDGIIDTKYLFSCFTLDVISSCCFGIEINAIREPDNVLIKNLKQMFSNPNLIPVFLFPSLGKYLCQKGVIEVFPKAPFRFIEKVVGEVIDKRRAKQEVREDFIQHMIEHEQTERAGEAAKKPSGYLRKSLTDKEISAQAMMFLAAGYETTGTTLTFSAYNLAIYQDKQKILQEEIDRVLEEFNGEIGYESVAKMPYLDAVINETLRIYPPGGRLDRICGTDFDYTDPETGTTIKIPKGHVVSVAVWTIHHDPEIYPDPEAFLPERFLEKAGKIEAEKFMPFGIGPRNCIAMRFALMEVKLLLAKIISEFEFVKSETTPMPQDLELNKFGLIVPAKPLYLKIERRNH